MVWVRELGGSEDMLRRQKRHCYCSGRAAVGATLGPLILTERSTPHVPDKGPGSKGGAKKPKGGGKAAKAAGKK